MHPVEVPVEVIELGELFIEMKDTKHWEALNAVKNQLLRDSWDKILLPMNKDVPLMCEPTFGQVMAARISKITAIEDFFKLIEMYVHHAREKRGDKK